MKISIVGAGNMGGAIARGVARQCGDISLVVSNRSAHKLDALKSECPSICVTTDNVEAVKDSDIVILAVKPFIMPSVIEEIKGSLDPERQAIVSIAGGVSLDDLDEMLGGSPFPTYHIIPTTAIAVGRSMTFISCRRAQQETTDMLCQVFGSLGQVAVIEERLMGAATALSSCGIAYVYKYVQACVQAGVQMGFYPKDAQRYVQATIDGAIAMLEANGTMPQTEIDRVTTPGGMTIKGINTLDHCGFTSAVINANLAPLSKYTE